MSEKSLTPLLKQLDKLIAFQTVNLNKVELDRCFTYLNNQLKAKKLHTSVHSSSGFPSIIATTKATKTPHILLQAHIDVVPGDIKLFKLREQSNRLYGRGVFDMKFAAACYLQLLNDLELPLDQYNFGIMLTADEEIGGENGVAYLLKQGCRADICILPDGGNNFKIETSSNDIWLVRLSTKGVSAHGSTPWDGKNAIDNLIYVINEIKLLFESPKPFCNSLTLSQINGGQAINQVPNYAEATIDMRFADKTLKQSQLKAINQIVKKHHVKLETLAQVDGIDVDLNHPEVSKFLELAKATHKKPIKPVHSFGSSDARYFYQHNIPTVIMRPKGGGAHSEREWLDKADFNRFYELLKIYIEEHARV